MTSNGTERRTSVRSIDDEDVATSRSHATANPSTVSRRASRALSINRLSKLMMRDSMSPALTKDDLKLDAEVNVFKENEFSRFSELMYTMDEWFSKHKRMIRVALAVLYRTRYWSASYYKIKNILRNFKAPCNDFEMHVICRVLDTLEIRRVSYKVFSKGSSHILLTNGLGLQKLNAATYFAVPEPEVTPSENLLLEEEKKFTNILFMYGPFYDIVKHPGHFSQVVCLDLFVYSLKKIIEKHVGLVSEVRVIYGMRFMERMSTLPWSFTLWELDFKGGCEKFPTMLTLYYDIDTSNRVFDCSLFLNSNYYLIDKTMKVKRTEGKTTSPVNLSNEFDSKLSRMLATSPTTISHYSLHTF